MIINKIVNFFFAYAGIHQEPITSRSGAMGLKIRDFHNLRGLEFILLEMTARTHPCDPCIEM